MLDPNIRSIRKGSTFAKTILRFFDFKIFTKFCILKSILNV